MQNIIRKQAAGQIKPEEGKPSLKPVKYKILMNWKNKTEVNIWLMAMAILAVNS